MLHIDKNDYYGGAEAALSLQEVESWTGTAAKGRESLCLSVSIQLNVKQVRPLGIL